MQPYARLKWPTTLLGFTLFLFAIGCAKIDEPQASPTATSQTENVSQTSRTIVLRVIDGATIEVDIDGQIRRVSYMGVDIPDRIHIAGVTTSPEQLALEFNRFLVQGQTVELQAGVVDSDLQGNLLRYVYLNGEMINEAILTNGYATVATYPPEFRFQTAFQLAVERARANLRGIWQRPDEPSAQSAQANEETKPPPPKQFGTLPSLTLSGGDIGTCDYSGTLERVIKGASNSATGERLYHTPGSATYDSAVVTEAEGGLWFCTEFDALSAGWRRASQ